MSYAMAPALQAAIFQHLVDDPALAALVGADIFDMAPVGAVPPLYVTLGLEEARDRSDGSAAGALHELTISVVAEAAGFATAKAVAAAISDALDDPALTLARGRLVWLRFLRARARLGASAGQRQIDLRFRARVEDI
jgi:hypothetical protein